MNYNDKEKRAIVELLNAVIHTDGFVHTKEIDYMALVEYELGMPRDVLADGLGVGPETACDIIRNMDNAHKKDVSHLLTKMLNADKSIPDEEIKVFNKILSHCSIEI